MRHTLLLTLGVLLLAGCGFSLRTASVDPALTRNLELNLQQEGSEIAALVRRSLGTQEPADGEPIVLSVSAEQLVSRPVSINPRARAAQYELLMTVEFSLTRDGEMLIPPETLATERVYFEDIENITGNLEEVETIKAEMRRELVNQLLRRLQAVGSGVAAR